jgi:hypothetical protein
VLLCEGASYTWPQNGLSYTADESPVVLNLTDDNGCAYTATLTINEYPVTPNIVNSVTVCEGASYTWPQNGLSYTADESPVVLNLTDDNGCAYTATLTINEYPVTPNIVNSVTVCEGASYTWPQNGLSYTADESPVVLNLTDDNGCAYTATLTINEYPVTPNIVNSVTVCEGASYIWPQNGLSYTADESPVVLNLTDDNGCAYTATLTINEYPVTPNIVNSVTVCEGASYTWPQNGLSYTADESPVVLNLTDDNGCAYTATLTINEYPVTPNIVNSVTVCEGASYTWPQNGLSYTADESPVVLNLTDDNGCAYTATLTINEYPVTPNIVNSVTVCEGASYIWPVDGLSYTADDSPVEITLTDANGCDYTATLTIDEDAAPDAGGNGVLTVCEGSIPTEAELFAALTGTPDAGGEWSGPVNGVYTYTFAASGSCPESSATVTVDEYPVTPNIVNSVTVCEGASYTWPQNGLSYTADESPVVLNLTDDNGCAYTATLTINEYPVTPNIVNSVTVCEGASYIWPQNGLSYTADESPVVLNLTDDNGCTYTATLTINEYPVTPNIVNSVTVCEGASYTWPQNGLSYTADESPVVLNLTDDNGCAYTATLTINEYPVTPNIVNSVTVCEGASYTWPQNGLSYTADESPVVLNLTDDNGCAYTATLTINEYPVTPNIVNSVTVCEGASYIWPQNGLSYTADESPVVLNLTDDNGCAYTATLTINEYPVTPNIVNSVTVCEGASYIWPQNGLSYTADESPVVLNLTDDNGCAYTATLTINEYPVTPNIVNSVTVCEGASYTWPQNGLSYTADESPVVLNLTDDNGCAYTATLTINEYPVTPNIVNSVTVCEGASYTWPQNGLSYTADDSPVVFNTDRCQTVVTYTATLTIDEDAAPEMLVEMEC